MDKKTSFSKDLSRVVITVTSFLLLCVAVSVGIISYNTSIRESVKVMQSQLERLIEHMTMKQKMAEREAEVLSSYFFKNDSYSLESVETFLSKQNVDDEICEKTIYLNPDLFSGDTVPILYISKWDREPGSICTMKLKKKNYRIGYEFFTEKIDSVLWIGPYLELNDKKPYLGCIYKVRADDGRVLGFTEILFDQGPLSELMDNDEYRHWHVDLYTGDGELRKYLNGFHYYTGRDLSQPMDSLVYQVAESQKRQIAGRTFTFYRAESDEEHLSVVTEMPNGWALKMSCDKADAFKDARRIVAGVCLFLTIGLIILRIFLRRLIYRRTLPITEFSGAAASIAGHNFETYLPAVSRNDEIRTLRDSLDNMQTSLKKYVSELKTTTAAKARMESELSIARDIQQQILQKSFPENDRFDLYGYMCPAREVGGDMYDFEIEGDHLYLMIGDVSGKGVPAALIMTVATSMFRHLTLTTDIPLGRVVSHINDTIAYGNKNNMFLTLLVCKIDLSTREMTICNAGHNPMVIKRHGETPEFYRPEPNSICGVFSGLDFVEETVRLTPGTELLFYTDGVTEAMNVADEEFGEKRLLEWAGTIPENVSEKEILESLLTAVKSFSGEAQQSDDITMIGLKLD